MMANLGVFLLATTFFYQILTTSCYAVAKEEAKDAESELERTRRELRTLDILMERSRSRKKRGLRYDDYGFYSYGYPLYDIDQKVCEDKGMAAKYNLCQGWHDSGYCRTDKHVMREHCSKTCGFCKPPSPPVCSRMKHGCCWDNSIAHGPDGQGCPKCKNYYKYLCPRFMTYCLKPNKYGRFIRYHCFTTCGKCPPKPQPKAQAKTQSKVRNQQHKTKKDHRNNRQRHRNRQNKIVNKYPKYVKGH